MQKTTTILARFVVLAGLGGDNQALSRCFDLNLLTGACLSLVNKPNHVIVCVCADQ